MMLYNIIYNMILYNIIYNMILYNMFYHIIHVFFGCMSRSDSISPSHARLHRLTKMGIIYSRVRHDNWPKIINLYIIQKEIYSAIARNKEFFGILDYNSLSLFCESLH